MSSEKEKLMTRVYMDREDLENDLKYLKDMGCSRGLYDGHLRRLDEIIKSMKHGRYHGSCYMDNWDFIQLEDGMKCNDCKCITCASKVCNHCEQCHSVYDLLHCENGYVFMGYRGIDRDSIYLFAPNKYNIKSPYLIELSHIKGDNFRVLKQGHIDGRKLGLGNVMA